MVHPKDKITFHRVSKPSVFCDNALLSQHIRIALQGFGLLTGSRVRDITSPSWHPSSAENGYGAKLPENPTNIIYQYKGLLINGVTCCDQTDFHVSQSVRSWPLCSPTSRWCLLRALPLNPKLFALKVMAEHSAVNYSSLRAPVHSPRCCTTMVALQGCSTARRAKCLAHSSREVAGFFSCRTVEDRG